VQVRLLVTLGFLNSFVGIYFIQVREDNLNILIDIVITCFIKYDLDKFELN